MPLLAFFSDATNLCPAWDGNGAYDVFVRDVLSGDTECISAVSDSGAEMPRLSQDGRFVAFHSGSSNLVLDDWNDATDVFVFDRISGIMERVSVSSFGEEGNGDSVNAAISGDGRYVTFTSYSSNLVPGDSNGATDVFVRDRLEGSTRRVSVTAAGGEAQGLSSNGGISADGRSIAFTSSAANLVPDDGNEMPDVFVHDCDTGAVERVSVSSANQEGNAGSGDFGALLSLSGDGRFIVFPSYADTLNESDGFGTMDVFLRDRMTGMTDLASVSSDGTPGDFDSGFAGFALGHFAP